MTSLDDVVMYIVVDEKLQKGRAMSQACHCIMVYMDYIKTKEYESTSVDNELITYKHWSSCCTKIVKKTSNDELLKLIDNDKQNNIMSFFDDGVLTCVISKPKSRKNHDLDIIDFKLY
jgi:peptidyl-tRNA hydrolase